MKFNFKIQQYQTDAVDAVIKVFAGQGFHDKTKFIRDLGKMKSDSGQMVFGFSDEEMELYDPANDTGYKNELVELTDEQLLQNIQTIQKQNNIKTSASLIKDLGRCSLDIEMETGTGKTYVHMILLRANMTALSLLPKRTRRVLIKHSLQRKQFRTMCLLMVLLIRA